MLQRNMRSPWRKTFPTIVVSLHCTPSTLHGNVRSATATSHHAKPFVVSSCSFSTLRRNKELETAMPDYRQAFLHELGGRYENAAMLVQRSAEVLSNALGQENALSMQANLKLASLSIHQGDFTKAEKISSTNRNAKNPVEAALGYQFLAQMKMLQGDMDSALVAAEKSVELLNSQTEVTAFHHIGYGLEGLARLHKDDLTGSEKALVAATSWADKESPLAKMIAHNNLGMMQFYREPVDLKPFELDPSISDKIYETNDFIVPQVSLRGVKLQLSGRRQQWRLQQYFGNRDKIVDYIDEVDAYETTDRSDVTNSGVVTCGKQAFDTLSHGVNLSLEVNSKDDTYSTGTTEHSKDDPEHVTDEVLERTGAEIEKLFDSPDVKYTQETKVLRLRLKNLHFCLALSRLNSNVAEVLETFGKYEDMLECLQDALKDIDDFAHAHPHISGFAGTSLTMKASCLFHQKKPILSEGLYRAAGDLFKAPVAHTDIRLKYDYAVMRAGYGKLLTKWVKREAEGERMLQEAQEILESLPKFANGKLYLTNAFIFPLQL